MHIDTLSVHAVRGFEHGAVVPPIHLSSTFELDALTQAGDFAYQRGANPTRGYVESAIAKVEGAQFGFAFNSGMAAISAIFSLLKAGDEVLLSSAVYGGTFRYVDSYFAQKNLNARFLDDFSELSEAHFSPNTKMVFVETPGNPNLRVVDIARLAKLAKQNNALLIVDNTFLTGVLQRPLELGADAVIQSATKYLGGHSDLLAGAVTTNDPSIAADIFLAQKTFGAGLDPLTSFRLFQAIKTLPLRIGRQEENARALIEFLAQQEGIKLLKYPGSYSVQEAEIQAQQASGIGACFSFELADELDLQKFLSALELPAFAVSLGGVESLICLPATMTHEAMSPEAQAKAEITPRLLRFSAGIEHIDDLIQDFTTALAAAQS